MVIYSVSMQLVEVWLISLMYCLFTDIEDGGDGNTKVCGHMCKVYIAH